MKHGMDQKAKAVIVILSNPLCPKYPLLLSTMGREPRRHAEVPGKRVMASPVPLECV